MRHRYHELTSARNWTEAENAILKEAVQREAMRYHATQLQAQGIEAISALKDVSLSEYNQVKENLDWRRIAANVPGRVPSMCKVQWLSHEHPGVNRSPWTDEERIDLKRAVEEARRPVSPTLDPSNHEEEGLYGIDWEFVVGFLGTGRIASDCMRAYRSSFAKALPINWTPELDQCLLDAVSQFGEKNMANVAMSMPIVLSRQQCASRFVILKGTQQRGKWSPEEDQKLEALAEQFLEGTKGRWRLIAEKMGTRSDRQCRLRFQNVLDKSLRRDDWSDTEDQIIRDVVTKNDKIDYADLAKRLNRPLEMIRHRATAISKGQQPSKTIYRKAVKLSNPRAKGTESTEPSTSRIAQTPDEMAHHRAGTSQSDHTAPQLLIGDAQDDTASPSESDSEFEIGLSTRQARAMRKIQREEARMQKLRQLGDRGNT
ncbi:hypothetical protein CPB86DRAFT_781960 [Serendipita vermifera]|nr:hypothetical protein CPB86DRAFT_781960 [Serendipita vermifera]